MNKKETLKLPLKVAFELLNEFKNIPSACTGSVVLMQFLNFVKGDFHLVGCYDTSIELLIIGFPVSTVHILLTPVEAVFQVFASISFLYCIFISKNSTIYVNYT